MVAGMIAYMKEQEGCFTLLESLKEIFDKLVHHHPHVFGDALKDTPEEVLEQWDHIKENVDLLFTVVNLGRLMGVDPTLANLTWFFNVINIT